jgi:hypothetical protein
VTVLILGPTKKNINKLQKKWNDWYRKSKTTHAEIGLLKILDKSIPNLASITFLAEIGNKKILFSGDGMGQDIVDMLSKTRLLDSNGRLFVDVLKVPHHGSDRNTSPEFFNTVNAQYYVISANGRDDNPSLGTLKWIIESEDTVKRKKKIILTNMTSNIEKVLRQYDQNKFNYETVILEKRSDFFTVNL